MKNIFLMLLILFYSCQGEVSEKAIDEPYREDAGQKKTGERVKNWIHFSNAGNFEILSIYDLPDSSMPFHSIHLRFGEDKNLLNLTILQKQGTEITKVIDAAAYNKEVLGAEMQTPQIGFGGRLIDHYCRSCHDFQTDLDLVGGDLLEIYNRSPNAIDSVLENSRVVHEEEVRWREYFKKYYHEFPLSPNQKESIHLYIQELATK